MSMSFQKLKSQKNTYEKLQSEIDSVSKKTSYKDDRFWVPTVDKAGNGSATIRFLPPSEKDGDDAKPFVRIFSYGFKGPTGQYYIENSPSTIGLPCPAMELNSDAWAKDKKEEARARSRKTQFISNILVINDPGNPENNGKVFLFKYGKKIFDKIKSCSNPEFPDDPKFDPFNFWEGANFKLKIKKVAGYRNYDSSVFESPSELFNGDETKIEKVWKTQHSLNEFLLPANFKTYKELKQRLEAVLGKTPSTSGAYSKNTSSHEDNENEDNDDEMAVSTPAMKKPNNKKVVEETNDEDSVPFDMGNDSDSDDVDKLFEDLTKE